MHASPTTLPLVCGRIDTIIDRLDTLFFGSRHPTFSQYREKLDGIRSALLTCSKDVPGPLAQEMLHQLNGLKRDMPLAFNATVARGHPSAEFMYDWNATFPEITQYITFIANRVPEISTLPPPVPPTTQHVRHPSAHLSRTASQPAVAVSRAPSQGQTTANPTIYIPPRPEHMQYPGPGVAGSSRAMSYAAPVARPSVTGHRTMPSMPRLGVPPLATAYSYNAAGPVVPSRSPASQYPAAPVPPHLAHVYARSPVMGARY
ncbi:hypothetical protein BKA62DRAFT_299981 [Auriculariales sp. MPI-PUGE-AT-0066]|nr:hypothetical protein BKA62DRAFT_299981 [Auriculariales sp. MPI-PUGE-AT-0066]